VSLDYQYRIDDSFSKNEEVATRCFLVISTVNDRGKIISQTVIEIPCDSTIIVVIR